jgi:hypothetical protein
MGPVSAEIALVALDDRGIDGAPDPPHVHTAPASQARFEEREEKGEGPRGSKRTANVASKVTDVARERGVTLIRRQSRGGVDLQ